MEIDILSVSSVHMCCVGVNYIEMMCFEYLWGKGMLLSMRVIITARGTEWGGRDGMINVNRVEPD